MATSTFQRPFKILIILLLVIGTFSIGFELGKGVGVRSVVPEGEGKVLGQGEIPAGLGEDVNFSLFWDVWDFIKDDYVDQPVSEKDLFYGAMQGLVFGLGDPHSVFFTPEDAAEFQQDLSGEFSGIGAEIGLKDDQLQIVAPLPGTPAQRAGLQAGDGIYAIDGVDTAGMAVDEAVSRIRGEKGTPVVLTISHNGVDTLEEVTIIRDTITVESVKLTIREDGIAVIDIYFFNEDTTALFDAAVQKILTSDVSGLVVDLRNDPGGYLTSAIDVASAWAGRDVITYESQKDQKRPLIGTGEALLAGLPTVVLVNGGSASASEIVAGALQDFDLATIVGEQTFGKGSVQDYRDLPDGSAIKITIAKWLTPKGRSIDQLGITPDVIVEFTEEQFVAGIDPQMDKAIEVLNAE